MLSRLHSKNEIPQAPHFNEVPKPEISSDKDDRFIL